MLQANLHCTENGSDKVYNVSIDPIPGTRYYDVNTEYGRRGSNLTKVSKITNATCVMAKAVFDKVIIEKKAKGYKIVSDPSAIINPLLNPTPTRITDQEDTGFRPQLLNEVKEEDVQKYIDDPMWCAQEKYDGQRRSLVCVDGTLTGVNRKGLSVPIRTEHEQIPGKNYILDGEALGDKIMIFDHPLIGKGYRERYKRMLEKFTFDGIFLELAPVAWSKEAKQALLERVRTANGEGIVFKKIDAIYKPGRPASGGDQLKYKFTETCSCVVIKRHPRKRSVEVGVFDNSGLLTSVGNVTIYPNFTVPKEGEIVEVKYLYWYGEEGSLFQPVYLGERTDIDRTDCLMSKLKRKANINNDDESEA
jgi:bifunctional non-homologous end joining protein LigD